MNDSMFDELEELSDEDLAEVAGGRCGPCRPCGPCGPVGGGVVVVAPATVGNYTLSTVPTATTTVIATGSRCGGGGGFRGFSFSWFR